MKSPSGKIEWLCPECGSENIIKNKNPAFKGMRHNSGDCITCSSWWPWSTRIKISLKNG